MSSVRQQNQPETPPLVAIASDRKWMLVFRAVDITAKAGIPDSLKDGRKRAPVQPFGVRGLVTALGQDF